jgi:hypothetical protein
MTRKKLALARSLMRNSGRRSHGSSWGTDCQTT